ncbi:DUF4410 domain-containing protein [Mariprofundus sp. KV]|uniref:DUF4410 domain-containing protein n=1 Tax=Mariprofundus sp. KV TaxID=2608715 RepID=UPI0015A0076D|nr:DUF4410 domain-containing protein [Mariprofundus sp. KV]NWF36337.1 DUF4410 domain-containing protein [Mariprofundus sp. KV]
MKRGLFFCLVTASIMLAGCGSARNIVTEPTTTIYKTDVIEVTKANSTVQVPDEFVAYFDKRLRSEVHKSFANGNKLRLEYRFISFDEGSRFKRYMGGGIGNWGQGTLLIQADFYDENGNKLSSMQTDAVISGGFFGGSFESAIDLAVEKMTEYAIANFKG